MKTAELKPCPFCGEQPETDMSRSYRMIDDGELGKSVAIYCSKCPVDMALCREDYVGETPEYLLDVLTEAWNKRASTSRPDDEMPITEDWLLSVGFEKVVGVTGLLLAFKLGIVELFPTQLGWKVEESFIMITTRLQLRQLASLLNVNLNEQGEKVRRLNS